MIIQQRFPIDIDRNHFTEMTVQERFARIVAIWTHSERKSGDNVWFIDESIMIEWDIELLDRVIKDARARKRIQDDVTPKLMKGECK